MRPILLAIHQGSGLVVGLLLLVVGLSGSAIALWEETDRTFAPALYPILAKSKPLPLDQLVATAKANYPTYRLEGMYALPSRGEGQVYQMWFDEASSAQGFNLFLNPYTGEVIGSRSYEQSFVGWMAQLHTSLFAGAGGRVVVVIASSTMVVTAITGLFLWPGWRRLAQGFKIRWHAPWRIRTYDLHKTVGMASLFFLVIVGLTGIMMYFEQPVKTALHILTGTPQLPELKVQSPPVPRQTSLETMVAQAKQRFPEGIFSGVTFPSQTTTPLRVTIKFLQEPSYRGSASIWFDPGNGQVLRVEDRRHALLPNAIYNFLQSFHNGTFVAGRWMAAFYIVVGMLPGGLFLSGFMLWVSKLKKKTKVAEVAKVHGEREPLVPRLPRGWD